MFFRRSLKFAAVCARTGVWTHTGHMLMPRASSPLEGGCTAVPLHLDSETSEEPPLGFVDTVETRGGELLAYGQIDRGPRGEWHAIEMYLGREFVIPRFREIDTEECTLGRRRLWDWRIVGFEVTRYPPWRDLPAPRVEQSRPSW